jgi:hypothetical protein
LGGGHSALHGGRFRNFHGPIGTCKKGSQGTKVRISFKKIGTVSRKEVLLRNRIYQLWEVTTLFRETILFLGGKAGKRKVC